MNYKFSKFNHIVYHKDGYIVFNTLTLSLVIMEERPAKAVLENNITSFLNNFNISELQDLNANGIIVEDDVDEIKILKDAYWYNKYRDDTLHVSILTTLGCNFACPYCFETRRNVILTATIENAIIEFIKEQLNGKTHIHIDWYGGEPLTNIKSIERISKEIIEFADKNKIDYYASITTNGYLLNDEIVNRLVKLRLKSAQITLDGPKDIHDKMRPLYDKSGTFDVIIKNIKNASKYIKINLRININNENMIHINRLLEEISSIKNLCVAIKAIVPASYKEYDKDCLNASDYAKLVVEKYVYAQKLGMNTAIDKLFTGSIYRYCIVDSDSQFIISPTGKLFKCGESYLDDEKGIIGGLDENNKLVIYENKKPFWDKDPFSFNECMKCKVLPLCLGGCQMKRLIKKVESCSPEYKYALDDLIKLYYDAQVGEN